jgi:hypothetical protein
MTTARDLTDADLSLLRVRASEFQDTDLWKAMRSTVVADRERVLTDLTDRNTTGEHLKFAQGELAQANRDIMLVERFLRGLAAEQQRRQRAGERG